MAHGLRDQAISGMIWSSIGKFGTLGVNFISNLVLARLLQPSDYGCVGMLYVFIAVSSVFVSAGFGSALIQKKNPTNLDYNSVFLFNLTTAIVLYFVLFFCAPSIASFYQMPDLCKILRVQSITLIIQAFSTIQSVQLQKKLDFKQLSIRNFIAAICGTTVGIVFAFLGFGAWSLVFSQVVAAVVGVFLLWWMSTWRPNLDFSWQSLKDLFSFGGLIALSSLVETLYTNLQSLIIGKWFSPVQLGYYSQAKKLEDVPTTALSQIVNQVSFPIFSSLQDDKARLKSALRANIKSITFINFPLMVILIIVAEPLITLLYGSKWAISIPYFQILCVSSMIYTMNTINTNVIKSLGKSKLFFCIQLIKRVLGIAMIVVGMRFGIYGLLWAVALLGYVCLVINLGVNKRLINYGYREQVKDVGVYYLVSVCVGGIVYWSFSACSLNPYVEMFLQVMLYIVLYFSISSVAKFDAFYSYVHILKSAKQRYKK